MWHGQVESVRRTSAVRHQKDAVLGDSLWTFQKMAADKHATVRMVIQFHLSGRGSGLMGATLYRTQQTLQRCARSESPAGTNVSSQQHAAPQTVYGELQVRERAYGCLSNIVTFEHFLQASH